MVSFKKGDKIKDLQKHIKEIYALNNDRIYPSFWNLLTQNQRFTTRALKGIRKGDTDRLKINLVISLSWFMSVCNKFHIDIEDLLWERFPSFCPYCKSCPCECKSKKTTSKKKMEVYNKLKPKSLKDFQEMFNKIYPASKRTLADAGVHLAEEMGEFSEALDNYFGEHTEERFNHACLEMADFLSCIFGVANSVPFSIEDELVVIFKKNCHVCHKAPCVCNFSTVSKYKS